MRARVLAASLTLALCILPAIRTNAQTAELTPLDSDLSSLSNFDAGVRAYIYGYPLVALGMTERLITTIADDKTVIGHSPINQFYRATALPNSSWNDVVLPSTTTLYANAFLNLHAEPIVMHIPKIEGRFFIVQTLDAWTNVSRQSPSSRRGSKEGDYAYVPRGWHGILPWGVQRIEIDTQTVWLIARIYTSGTKEDVDHVTKELFPQFTLTPLSKLGNYTPPDDLPVNPSIDTKTQPVIQTDNLSGCDFFATMAAMMITNPTRAVDVDIAHRLAKIGFYPGQYFDCSRLTKQKRLTLEASVAAAKKILNSTPPPSQTVTKWSLPLNVGDYGRQYLLRALVAKNALGANQPNDAVYGLTTIDSSGAALSGDLRYQMHFLPATSAQNALEIPPVNAGGFWSITIYNLDGSLVANEVVDYNAIGIPEVQAHPATLASDKSLTIYLQSDKPSHPEQFKNWIPTPPGKGFKAFMRMYWPEKAITEGKWYPPGIDPIK